MQIITRDQVKTQLGITDSSYDAEIDAKLPIIDAKVKLICRNNFELRFAADMTDTEITLSAYSLYDRMDLDGSGIMNPNIVKDISKSLEVGMEIEGTNIPTGAYIKNIYKSGTVDLNNTVQDLVYIEISDAVTATASGVIATGGFNIAHHPTVAKGVWYLIGTTSTTIDKGDWISRNVGPLQISRSEMMAKLEGIGGMPAWFVQALPRWQGGM